MIEIETIEKCQWSEWLHPSRNIKNREVKWKLEIEEENKEDP